MKKVLVFTLGLVMMGCGSSDEKSGDSSRSKDQSAATAPTPTGDEDKLKCLTFETGTATDTTYELTFHNSCQEKIPGGYVLAALYDAAGYRIGFVKASIYSLDIGEKVRATGEHTSKGAILAKINETTLDGDKYKGW